MAVETLDTGANGASTTTSGSTKTLHIAPMLHVSNSEFRHFFRILSKHCVLWTEMVVDETIVFNRHNQTLLESHLGLTGAEHPTICQIGGITPELTAQATVQIEDFGYDEINLNMDCPSDRVSGKRHFGAVLMKELDHAMDIVRAMKENARNIPVSIKCRVGIDDFDSFEYLVDVISKLSQVCKRFYLHARKCILAGLTPEQNRLVPPLNYPRVYALCEQFPDCQFWINGGIPGLKAAKELVYGNAITNVNDTMKNINDTAIQSEQEYQQHQVPCTLCQAPNGSCTAPPAKVPSNLLGCMLGRAAMDNPSQFWDVDRYFYDRPRNPCQNRTQVLEQYCHYLDQTYPRRCCDDDDEQVTSRIPAPKVIFQKPYCPICREYRSNDRKDTHDDKSNSFNNHTGRTSKIKITSRVVDRSLKPVLGIFFRQPGSKTFRRECDLLSRDTEVRNCGPAFILYKALQVMKPEVLDQDFVKTEDTKDSDITVHVSPPSCSPCLS